MSLNELIPKCSLKAMFKIISLTYSAENKYFEIIHLDIRILFFHVIKTKENIV